MFHHGNYGIRRLTLALGNGDAIVALNHCAFTPDSSAGQFLEGFPLAKVREPSLSRIHPPSRTRWIIRSSGGDGAARHRELSINAGEMKDGRVSDVTYKGKHDKCQRLRCHRGGVLTVTAAAARESRHAGATVDASQINVNVKRELKISVSRRRRANKLDLSFCLQFVLLSGFDHLPASACHVKPFMVIKDGRMPSPPSSHPPATLL